MNMSFCSLNSGAVNAANGSSNGTAGEVPQTEEGASKFLKCKIRTVQTPFSATLPLFDLMKYIEKRRTRHTANRFTV